MQPLSLVQLSARKLAKMPRSMFAGAETAVEQCVDKMEQALTLSELQLSDAERLAFDRMWRVCRSFLAEHERLLTSECE